MSFCTSCGANNAIGIETCVQCGAVLAQSQTHSSETNSQSTGYAPNDQSGNIPPQGNYTPPPQVVYVQQQQAYKHPAFLAILSLFFPGLGMLFVPNKAAIGLIMMGAYILLWFLALLLSAVYIGCCLMICIPIFNFAAAIYSYDSGAKLTNGEFNPIIFK